MNMRLKYIAVLVIVALLGVAAYQAYWLEQLHFTIGEQMDNDIQEAMRVADLKEVFLRLKSIEDKGPHGTMDVRAGIEEDGSITTNAVTTTQVTVDGEKLEQKTGVVLRSNPQAGSDSTAGDDAFMQMLEEQISVTELASMIQRGLHLGVDRFEGTRYEKYDSLLTAGLQQLGLSGEHRLLRPGIIANGGSNENRHSVSTGDGTHERPCSLRRVDSGETVIGGNCHIYQTSSAFSKASPLF